MCCAAMGWEEGDVVNGECPECGADTVDGDAYEQCSYSPTLCELCNDSPCDGSC
jgi:hypothetical protein